MLRTQLAAVPNWIRRRGPARWPSGERDPMHWSFLVMDVTGFGRLDNSTQLWVREVLTTAVREAFRGTGVWWFGLAVEDRGDGKIILVPAAISKVVLLVRVIPRLARVIRECNTEMDGQPRIRLRVSLHAGEVLRDATGWVGTDLTMACRLVDNATVRRHLLQRPDADVLVVVSDTVYRGVVRHGYPGIDPDAYAPVRINRKELRTRAWLHVPDGV